MNTTRTFVTPEVAHGLISASGGRIAMCNFDDNDDSPFPNADALFAFRATRWIEGCFTAQELADAKAGANAAFVTVKKELVARGLFQWINVYATYTA